MEESVTVKDQLSDEIVRSYEKETYDKQQKSQSFGIMSVSRCTVAVVLFLTLAPIIRYFATNGLSKLMTKVSLTVKRDDGFQDYTSNFNKVYTNETEKAFRKEKFAANQQKIVSHNSAMIGLAPGTYGYSQVAGRVLIWED